MLILAFEVIAQPLIHHPPPLVLMSISEEKMNPGNYTLQHVTKALKIENNQNKNISREKKLKNV